jgi:hypothetical protein
MSQSLILVDALIPLNGERRIKEKKKRERSEKLPWGRRVSPELDLPCWLCHGLQLLDAIKD